MLLLYSQIIGLSGKSCTHFICRMATYPVDKGIHSLNNRVLMNKCLWELVAPNQRRKNGKKTRTGELMMIREIENHRIRRTKREISDSCTVKIRSRDVCKMWWRDVSFLRSSLVDEFKSYLSFFAWLFKSRKIGNESMKTTEKSSLLVRH